MNKLVLALVSFSILAPCLDCFGRTYVEEQHNNYPLSEQGVIDLENINGQVRVVAWDRNDVQLDAVKHANNAEDLQALEIRVDSTPGRLKVRTIQPSTRKYWWWPFKRSRSGWVDYSLKVPSQARLESISTVNGSIGIENVATGIKASSVNGSVNVTGARGSLQLSTVNGSVNASLDPATGHSISMKAVNGSLSLELPSSISADLSASTVNGRVACEFDMPTSPRRAAGRNLKAQFGQGEIPIRLETVNGKITILKKQVKNLDAAVER